MAIKYFNGDKQLDGARMASLDQFLALGGVKNKHNFVSPSQRMIGWIGNQLFPVTRKIDYKSNPSKHKCSAKCLSATGHVCECECGGKNHGLMAIR